MDIDGYKISRIELIQWECKETTKWTQREYKHLNELKEDANKQIDEMKKAIEDMKEAFNKDIESLKTKLKIWK
jgi:predicted  nucleic acid-binding Zn-ribbon protein